MKYFYSHIIEIESIITKLDEVELDERQKLHLAGLIDSTIHHTVLDIIFSNLNDGDKFLLIEKLKISSGDQSSFEENKEIMDFLSQRIDNIEGLIKNTVEGLKKELHEDIEKSKKLKKRK